MNVLFIPLRLRFCAALFFLAVPLAVAETLLVSRLPWWQLSYRPVFIWGTLVAVISLVLVLTAIRGHRWAMSLIGTFFGGWVIFNAGLAIHMRFPTLGIFAVITAPLFLLEGLWLQGELGRSFFDPQLAWYEGLPRAIPFLECEISTHSPPLKCQVCRLDEDGVFVFLRNPPPPINFDKKRPLELKLQFRQQTLAVLGFPRVQLLHRGWGIGVQFKGLSLDQNKDLADFVETLRGEGYVE